MGVSALEIRRVLRRFDIDSTDRPAEFSTPRNSFKEFSLARQKRQVGTDAAWQRFGAASTRGSRITAVPLSPYRVIDLTDHRGHMAGYLMAALGADVIAVEPPEGSRARTQAPFVTTDDVPAYARSLTHAAYGRGRLSVTADLTSPAGREVLHRLLAGADVLL